VSGYELFERPSYVMEPVYILMKINIILVLIKTHNIKIIKRRIRCRMSAEKITS